ncbi:hypothetical protein ONZ43_g6691 [Nemania bipapillata]|uniref:Uncharacterized protein n=1 Tax=Nemania bipapillata TaxID=110536 RepID=A0ACC2HX35_9PEZI|nr:hypothetical protein ONZ43_g6691 [Nemania bipapillata]
MVLAVVGSDGYLIEGEEVESASCRGQRCENLRVLDDLGVEIRGADGYVAIAQTKIITLALGSEEEEPEDTKELAAQHHLQAG